LRIERTRRFTVTPEPYNSVTVGVTISMSNNDVGVSDEQMASFTEDQCLNVRQTLEEAVDEMLETNLQAEINDVLDVIPHKHWFSKSPYVEVGS